MIDKYWSDLFNGHFERAEVMLGRWMNTIYEFYQEPLSWHSVK